MYQEESKIYIDFFQSINKKRTQYVSLSNSTLLSNVVNNKIH